jgi:hypothetical protein
MTARTWNDTAMPRLAWPRAWLFLLVGCALAIFAVDTALIFFTTGFFTSGFNGVYVDSFPMYSGFVIGSLILDLTLVLGIWTLALPLLRLLQARTLPTLALAGSVAVGVPLMMAIAHYNLHVRLGEVVTVKLLREIAQGSNATFVAQALEQMEGTEFLVPLFGSICLLFVAIGARKIEPRFSDVERRFATPSLRSVAVAFALAAVCATWFLALPSESAATLRRGMRSKPSQIALMEIVRRATDLDGDGYGLLPWPADAAPLDPVVHPYAVDLPGNGKDENGIGGDHPAAFVPVPVEAAPAPREGARPHVLLIFLETFRADLLGARLGGREITPYLNQLARAGASSARTFVHCPSTVPSRAQLLTGSLAYLDARTTLIDDFADRGYTVGYFSGQDESYGDARALLGLDRADAFYDARMDVAKRTSRSAAPVSLQVSWKTVLSRVREFLPGADPSRPVFLYVNFTDPHFPYFHREIDPILEVESIARSDIRADRAQKVWEAYANTAANVDRAVEELVGLWRAHVGDADHAIVVTADHGQAFYEKGYLGHGESLDDAQTRIPLILWGIGGDWPEPLGIADIRGLLGRNLGAAREGGVPVARFVPDPERRVLQWAANIERPHVVGLRGLERTVLYDFRTGQLSALTPDEAPLHLTPDEESAERRALIWNWEAVQRRQAASDGASSG